MGADVHMFVEVKKNGKWEKVGKVFPNPYYDKNRENQIDEDGFEWNAKKTDSPYTGRNYDLFAILANVRNGRGFAGCDTGDGFVPIDMPRDLPKDVSPEIQKLSDDYGVDGHSHSHFTLRELMEYNWNQETKHRGYVDVKGYAEFKKDGSPNGWCGGIDGGSIRKISNAEMQKMFKTKAKKEKDGLEYYTLLEWGVSYREAAGPFFFKKTIPALAKLSKNPDHVRIVFFFDN